MGFNEKLKKLRIEKGISQKKLAESIGVAQSSINYWEKGQRSPSVEAARKLAEFFNITLDELYDLEYLDTPDKHYTDKTSAISTYADVEQLIARNGKEYTTEQKMRLIKLLSEIE